MERQQPATAVIVDYVCDECRHGHMMPTGEIRMDEPAWPHMCNNCGYIENFSVKYPDVRFTRET